MRVWRIASRRFLSLDGRGAELFGGRWNSPGRALVYASSTLSLAMLEMLARLPTGEIPTDYAALPAVLPAAASLEEVEPGAIDGWDAPNQVISRGFGDAWLAEARSLALLVPAMAVPQERNVLINPHHPQMPQIEIGEPLSVLWDRRLFERR